MIGSVAMGGASAPVAAPSGRGGGGDNEYRSLSGRFAQSLFASLTDWHYYPLDIDTDTSALALTGSATSVFINLGGGMLQISTGATAGSRVLIINKQDASNDFAVTSQGLTDVPYYVQGRFMVTTALDAQAVAMLRLGNTALNANISLGFRGLSSTAFLTLEGIGISTVRNVTTIPWPANIATTVIDVGVAVDGNRIIPCAGNVLLGTMRAYTADAITDPNAIPGTVLLLGFDVQNGTTAAARTMRAHKFFYARAQQP